MLYALDRAARAATDNVPVAVRLALVAYDGKLVVRGSKWVEPLYTFAVGLLMDRHASFKNGLWKVYRLKMLFSPWR